MKKNKKAFTLVELIVVLIIIVILGTIAYYSLQGHNKDARNSIRISALTSFEEQLELYSVKTGGLPIPEDYVEIYSSGVLIGYQGYLGEKILGLLNIKGGKDPLDEEYYTYIVDTKRRNFEIMAFLEESEMIFNIPKNIYADNSKRTPYVKGKKVGIIVNQTNDPIQKLITGSFDIANTNDIYKSYLNNETIITGTGIELRKTSPTYSCERIFELSKKPITGNYNIDNHYSTGSSTLNVNCDLDLDGLTPIAKSTGGSLVDILTAMYVDNEGYIYIGGYFNDTVNFLGQTITSVGGSDFYFAKLDNNLNLIWVKNGGGSGSDYIQGIGVDNNGNVYVSGYFNSPSIDILGETISLIGGYDYFFLKLDENGNKVWLKNGGGSGNDNLYRPIIDNNGYLYLGGTFSDMANIFGDNITAISGTDFFITKLDSNGNKIWLKSGGGSGSDYIMKYSIDNNGYIYLGGYFNSSNATIFGDTISTNGGYDYFLAKIDNDGNKIWLKNGGSISSNDYIYTIGLDNNGYIYLGGYYSASTNIFGENLTFNGGTADYFLTKLDNNGNKIWLKNGGGTGNDYLMDLGVDKNGDIFIGGRFDNNGTIIFGEKLKNYGSVDYYIGKIDTNGNTLWIRSGGGTGIDVTRYLYVDVNGNVYHGIRYNGTLDFLGETYTSNGVDDFLITKLFK